MVMTHLLSLLTLLLWSVTYVAPEDATEDKEAIQQAAAPFEHMDESWPTTSLEVFRQFTSNAAQQELYSRYMEGCYENIDKDICDRNEKNRMALNALQPSLMENITAIGYAKMKTPTTTQQILKSYLERFEGNLEYEEWWTQTHTNHWDRTPDSHDIQLFMPLADRQTIQREVQDVLEQWCGVSLTFTSMYGLRIYREGAVLAPHVDRLPLVISAILNVDQEMEEGLQDWPLEVIGRDGFSVNLTLQPGEMVLYESHSIIHGRPYPLEKW